MVKPVPLKYNLFIRQKNFFLMGGVLALISGFGVSQIIPTRFVAQSLIQYQSPQEYSDLQAFISKELLYYKSDNFGIQILEKLNPLKNLKISREQKLSLLNQKLKIYSPPNAASLKITYADNNAAEAKRMVNAIAALLLIDHNKRNPEVAPSAPKAPEQMPKRENKVTIENNNDVLRDYQLFLKEKTALEAQIDNLKNNLGVPTKGTSIPALTNSSYLRELEYKLHKAHEKHNTLALRYGPKHPKVISAQTEINNINNKIALGSDRIIKPLLLLLKSKLSELKELEAKLVNYNEAKTNFIEVSLPSEQIISAVTSKIELTAPKPFIAAKANFSTQFNKPIIHFLSILAGIILFLLFYLLAYLRDNRLRQHIFAAQEIEYHFNLPCDAMIPKVPYSACVTEIGAYILNNPTTAVSESLRAYCLKLLQFKKLHKKSEGIVISLASCLPNAGKSLLSLWISRILAKNGYKIILVETDLRRAALSTLIENKPHATLDEYLTDNCALKDIIYHDDLTTADIIAARNTPHSAAELLGNKKFETLIKTLKKSYDFIIIDTVPVLSVSDSLPAHALSDKILFIIPWGKARYELVHKGLQQLEKTNFKKISFILNNIDVKKHSKMGYNDTYDLYAEYIPLEA